MKILLVTFHFPPDGEIGGVRPYELARHLTALGMEVWVLTVRPEFAETPDPSFTPEGVPGERIVRTQVDPTFRDRVLPLFRWVSRFGFRERAGQRPERVNGSRSAGRESLAARARTGLLSILSFPDRRIGWLRPAVRAGKEVMARQRFDVLISTSPPRTAHFIGSRLARFAGVPWVMDFRDPWVMRWQPPGAPPTRVPRLQRWLFHHTCSRASAIVANTPQLLADIAGELGPSLSFRRCIPNGFTAPPPAASPGGRTEFTVGYFGQMPGQRSADVFLRGLRAWLDEAPQTPDRVRVRFVGKGFDREERRTRELDLTEYVVFSPTVPRAVALDGMRQQWVLLLIANGQPLQVPGKALEYLATGRRILALTEARSATASLLDGQDGCTVVAAPDGVTAALRDYWQEFVGGAPAVLDRSELFETATHERRAASYAGLLKEVVNTSI